MAFQVMQHNSGVGNNTTNYLQINNSIEQDLDEQNYSFLFHFQQAEWIVVAAEGAAAGNKQSFIQIHSDDRNN